MFSLVHCEPLLNGPHILPTYRGSKGSLKLFTLTPLTLAADATVIGSVLAYAWAYGMASGGYR